jgi:hypothetical protein
MLGRMLLLGFAILPVWSGDWNPRLAAEYLDGRQKLWIEWPRAQRLGAPCLSCHTGVPYLLARPALRRANGGQEPTVYEQALLDGLRTRLDKATAKEFSGTDSPRAAQALGVEAILAALFLANDQALNRMWALQLRDGPARGAWAWTDADLDPWEMPESTYFGAALAALATGEASAEYRRRPEVRERISELIGYLEREWAAQPLHHRLTLLWASARLPEVLPKARRHALLDEVWQRQQPDGGWSLESLGAWKKRSAAPPAAGSNSYAAGFTAFVLQTAGVRHSDPRLRRALAWLESQQDREQGFWAAESMNKHYESGSMAALFMRDAATAFATLALLPAD